MFDGCSDVFMMGLDEQMHMVWHEAVGIEGAEWWLAIAQVIEWLQHLLHEGEKADIVFLVFEDILQI